MWRLFGANEQTFVGITVGVLAFDVSDGRVGGRLHRLARAGHLSRRRNNHRLATAIGTARVRLDAGRRRARSAANHFLGGRRWAAVQVAADFLAVTVRTIERVILVAGAGRMVAAHGGQSACAGRVLIDARRCAGLVGFAGR